MNWKPGTAYMIHIIGYIIVVTVFTVTQVDILTQLKQMNTTLSKMNKPVVEKTIEENIVTLEINEFPYIIYKGKGSICPKIK